MLLGHVSGCWSIDLQFFVVAATTAVCENVTKKIQVVAAYDMHTWEKVAVSVALVLFVVVFESVDL